ncbi:hypothetical protein ACI65C_007496 [Semiaphis heraclei]
MNDNKLEFNNKSMYMIKTVLSFGTNICQHMYGAIENIFSNWCDEGHDSVSLHTFPTFTRVTCNGFAITDLFILFINKHNNWLQCVFNNSFTRKIIIKNDVNTHNAILQSCDDRAKFSPENEIKRDSSLSYADKKKVLVISMRQMKYFFFSFFHLFIYPNFFHREKSLHWFADLYETHIAWPLHIIRTIHLSQLKSI